MLEFQLYVILCIKNFYSKLRSVFHLMQPISFLIIHLLKNKKKYPKTHNFNSTKQI